MGSTHETSGKIDKVMKRLLADCKGNVCRYAKKIRILCHRDCSDFFKRGNTETLLGWFDHLQKQEKFIGRASTVANALEALLCLATPRSKEHVPDKFVEIIPRFLEILIREVEDEDFGFPEKNILRKMEKHLVDQNISEKKPVLKLCALIDLATSDNNQEAFYALRLFNQACEAMNPSNLDVNRCLSTCGRLLSHRTGKIVLEASEALLYVFLTHEVTPNMSDVCITPFLDLLEKSKKQKCVDRRIFNTLRCIEEIVQNKDAMEALLKQNLLRGLRSYIRHKEPLIQEATNRIVAHIFIHAGDEVIREICKKLKPCPTSLFSSSNYDKTRSTVAFMERALSSSAAGELFLERSLVPSLAHLRHSGHNSGLDNFLHYFKYALRYVQKKSQLGCILRIMTKNGVFHKLMDLLRYIVEFEIEKGFNVLNFYRKEEEEEQAYREQERQKRQKKKNRKTQRLREQEIKKLVAKARRGRIWIMKRGKHA